MYLHPSYAEQNLSATFIGKITVITKLENHCINFLHLLGKKISDRSLCGTLVPWHKYGRILKCLWDH